MNRTPRLLLRAVCLAAVGCGDCDFDVVGGTVAERDTVHRAVDRFLAAVGDDAFCVPRFRIAEEPRSRGRYNKVSRQVRIAAGLPPDVLVRTVTHELCHAFDVQQDFTRGRDERFFFERDIYGEHSGDPDSLRTNREAFAVTCEIGPDAVRMVVPTCGDPVDVSLEALGNEVFVADPPLPTFAHLVERARFEMPGIVPGERVTIEGFEDGIVHVVQFDHLHGGFAEQVLDLDDGTLLPIEALAGTAPLPTVVAGGGAPPEGWVAHDLEGGAWWEKEGVVVEPILQVVATGTTTRLVAIVGDDIQRVDGCPPPGWLDPIWAGTFFPLRDGGLGVGWVEPMGEVALYELVGP